MLLQEIAGLVEHVPERRSGSASHGGPGLLLSALDDRHELVEQAAAGRTATGRSLGTRCIGPALATAQGGCELVEQRAAGAGSAGGRLLASTRKATQQSVQPSGGCPTGLCLAELAKNASLAARLRAAGQDGRQDPGNVGHRGSP
jgi:hypothetical protein